MPKLTPASAEISASSGAVALDVRSQLVDLFVCVRLRDPDQSSIENTGDGRRDAADERTDHSFGLLRASFEGAACSGRGLRV